MIHSNRTYMYLKTSAIALSLIAATSILSAQETAAPPSLPKGGIQVSSVSAYTAYYSSRLPNADGASFEIGTTRPPSDLGLGGSIVIDWTKFTERTSFSLNYTPSYNGSWRYSNLNAFNHQFSLNVSRKLAPRWALRFSAGVNLFNEEESLFSPTTLSNITSAPSTFTDFAGALLSSQYANNPQLGIILTNPSVESSPLSSLLYGERVLITSASASLSYSVSPRFSITFSGNGGYSQNISQPSAPNASNQYLLPDTKTGGGRAEFSYSLSPVTQIGGSVSTNVAYSSLYDSRTTTAQATLGRSLNRRWIVQLHGGVGVSSFSSGSGPFSAYPVEPRPVFGGSLGYKTLSHTFLGLYDAMASDTYGAGASSSSTAGFGWRWRRPRNNWWINAGVNWQQFSGNAVENTSGWRATAGLSRAVGSNAVLQAQYTYLDYSGGLAGSPVFHQSQSAVRVTMTWIPQPVLTR